jgi:hypothetical protein
LAPEYKINSAGQRELEPKDKMKERLKRSPDDMDALNLAYYEAPGILMPQDLDETSGMERRGLLGLGAPEVYEQRVNAERRGLYGR